MRRGEESRGGEVRRAEEESTGKEEPHLSMVVLSTSDASDDTENPSMSMGRVRRSLRLCASQMAECT